MKYEPMIMSHGFQIYHISTNMNTYTKSCLFNWKEGNNASKNVMQKMLISNIWNVQK
jgi:hypothetical protein